MEYNKYISRHVSRRFRARLHAVFLFIFIFKRTFAQAWKRREPLVTELAVWCLLEYGTIRRASAFVLQKACRRRVFW